MQEQDLTQCFMDSSQFKTWLTSPRSTSMVANMRSPTHDLVSSASFACAFLANLSGSQQSTLIMTFFCGLHADSSNEETGAGNMVASLIGQLLEQHNGLDLSFLRPDQRSMLEIHDLPFLCKVLKKLLRQLP